MIQQWRKLALVLLATACWLFLSWEAYRNLGSKGLLAEAIALGSLCALADLIFWSDLRTWWKGLGHRLSHADISSKHPSHAASRFWFWCFFFCISFLFFVFFPFSIFLHSVGIVPGIIFMLLFSLFVVGLGSEGRLHSLLAILALGMLFWLWGEAGRPGLIVMPVDLPEGDYLSFTPDGIANAIETELQTFGANEKGYGRDEASVIFSSALEDSLFPQNPWYKGSEARPPLLDGLQTSHVITGTGIEGFPLVNAYHILRHLRGMPLLEAQILIGADHSLTLALRRSNAPIECIDEAATNQILHARIAKLRQGAIADLWRATRTARTEAGDVPDNRACKNDWRNRARDFLVYLDAVPPPATSEQRLANVTIHDLQGDEQLSAALYFAALQSMEELSPERLAVYYDNHGQYDSSLRYFLKAVPYLLKEAQDASPAYREYARARFASALVRIGDFSGQCKIADQAYNLAGAIVPDNLHVLARIGYGYLVRARKSHWDEVSHYKSFCPDPDSSTPFDYPQLLDNSIDFLQRSLSSRIADSDSSPLGLTRRTETRAWARSNLAYALTLRSGASKGYPSLNTTKVMSEAKQDGDMVFGSDHPWDPRPAVTSLYVEEHQPNPDCDRLLEQLRALDQVSRHSSYASATLHNTLLLEEQLTEIYSSLPDVVKDANKTCRDEILQRISQRSDHLILFGSLLTLDYIQESSGNLPETFVSPASPDPHVRHVKGELLRQSLFLADIDQSGKRDERLKDLCTNQEGIAAISSDPWYASVCARATLRCNSPLEQLQQAEHAVNASPDDYFLRLNLGMIQMKLARFDEAQRTLKNASRLNPDEPLVRKALSFALNATDKPEEAREQTEFGRLLDPVGTAAGRYRTDAAVCSSARPFVPAENSVGNVKGWVGSEPPEVKHPALRKRVSEHELEGKFN